MKTQNYMPQKLWDSLVEKRGSTFCLRFLIGDQCVACRIFKPHHVHQLDWAAYYWRGGMRWLIEEVQIIQEGEYQCQYPKN